MPIVEYEPGTAFPGVIGRTAEESSPAWPALPRAKEGAPNVLFIVLDDTGFGQLGCYGSPIETPSLDRIAANGLRYNNMHTTALCSPSRSCIVTGRNHHANGMAAITELATGYPGYKAGWYRLANDSKALVFITNPRHVVYVPTVDGSALMMRTSSRPPMRRRTSMCIWALTRGKCALENASSPALSALLNASSHCFMSAPAGELGITTGVCARAVVGTPTAVQTNTTSAKRETYDRCGITSSRCECAAGRAAWSS